MSQRELARRIDISRQTVHNVIYESDWGFSETTFDALDRGLKWHAGTARAFHQGNPSSGEDRSIEERINEYLYTILQRLRQMDIDQLEREVLMLEEESNGRHANDDEVSRLIDAQIGRLVAALMHHDDRENVRSDAG